MNYFGGIGMLLVALLIMVVVFLLAREGVCWYWKINEQIALFRETNALLASIESRLKQASTARPAAAMADAAVAAPAPRMCPSCQSSVKGIDRFCQNCGHALAS
jgi:hypothetical protein